MTAVVSHRSGLTITARPQNCSPASSSSCGRQEGAPKWMLHADRCRGASLAHTQAAAGRSEPAVCSCVPCSGPSRLPAVREKKHSPLQLPSPWPHLRHALHLALAQPRQLPRGQAQHAQALPRVLAQLRVKVGRHAGGGCSAAREQGASSMRVSSQAAVWHASRGGDGHPDGVAGPACRPQAHPPALVQSNYPRALFASFTSLSHHPFPLHPPDSLRIISGEPLAMTCRLPSGLRTTTTLRCFSAENSKRRTMV